MGHVMLGEVVIAQQVDWTHEQKLFDESRPCMTIIKVIEKTFSSLIIKLALISHELTDFILDYRVDITYMTLIAYMTLHTNDLRKMNKKIAIKLT